MLQSSVQPSAPITVPVEQIDSYLAAYKRLWYKRIMGIAFLTLGMSAFIAAFTLLANSIEHMFYAQFLFIFGGVLVSTGSLILIPNPVDKVHQVRAMFRFLLSVRMSKAVEIIDRYTGVAPNHTLFHAKHKPYFDYLVNMAMLKKIHIYGFLVECQSFSKVPPVLLSVGGSVSADFSTFSIHNIPEVTNMRVSSVGMLKAIYYLRKVNPHPA